MRSSMKATGSRRTVSRKRIGRLLILPIAAAIAVSGCDGLLDVTDPDVATPESLDNPQALPTVIAGAIGDFAIAYQGGGGVGTGGVNVYLGLILATGMLSDEYHNTGTESHRADIDRRDIRDDNSDAFFLFHHLHKARTSAEGAAAAVERVAPGLPDGAWMVSLAGFSYGFLAEAFCSGVPVSDLVDGRITLGEPTTTAELLEIAVGRFDLALALAQASGSAEQEHLARIGKGRALLNLGRFADAAAAVAAVPTEFRFDVELNGFSSRQTNEPWSLSHSSGRFAVANRKGGNGLPFRDAGDPRVTWQHVGVGRDGVSPVYAPLKYPSQDSDVPLAEGTEARLIEAEDALRSGARDGFFATHNALRATVVGLDPLVDSGQSESELVDLHFQERAFWLWSTGHRLGDLRRLVRQYGRAPDAVFPTGAYGSSGVYGSAVNFPIPVAEQNNPHNRGCLDREA